MDGTGKVAIVTGAASGIGRATAQRLHANGWSVIAADRDADRLNWAEAAGIFSRVIDVTSEADNQALVAEAEARFGGLDAAVLNAGVTGGGAIDTMPFADFERVIGINLFGAVHGVRAAIPALARRGGGAITLTSSTMGVAGDAENSAYAASKHALIGLTRSLARELGWRNIRVNALCPGPTLTGMTDMIRDVAPAHYEMLRGAVPLQRWADPDEQAAVIEFLVSPASSFVNGHAMVADGGAMVGTGLVAPKVGAGNVMPDH